MTESFAYSTINHPFRADKIGSVGNGGPGIELKIADDDEIMVRSQGMFSGYYKNDIATQESFDSDGWLHTGDIGVIDSEGYLTIRGRKKDTFKTAKGKFVAPVPIENKLAEYSRVEMMCLIGLGLPAPILLVVPHDFPNFDRERYARTAERVIKRMNQELESHAQIKGVLMVKEPWSIENGLLTPTLKIKRHLLEQKYHEVGQNWPKGQLVVWEE
jgi:long-subunit acyl-CoA synthetase (AMP-forming)